MNNYEEFDKLITNKKINHAYLLSVDDNYSTSFSVDFVKKILSTILVDKNNYEKILLDIERGTFSDLKVIRPDGRNIKKDQLLELMSEYKNSSLGSIPRFYIIEYAEDLNVSSANTILKFLEEPENDIVAILVTKNRYSVLETIVSRCQIINCNKYRKRSFTSEECNTAINSLFYIEKYGKKSVAFLSDLYLMKSDELSLIFDIWISLYDEYISFKVNNKINNFERIELLNELFDIININMVSKRVNIIEKMKNLLYYNVNIRIVLDQLVLGGD